GGLLAEWDWRLVFWVNVPIGLFGTIWAYRSLREVATTRRARIDWVGNILFAGGLGVLLVAITNGIRPYGGHATGWTNPWILAGWTGAARVRFPSCAFEPKTAGRRFQRGWSRTRPSAAATLPSLPGATARGGLQFMLVIWLAGICPRCTATTS